jgi:hypothetical protein
MKEPRRRSLAYATSWRAIGFRRAVHSDARGARLAPQRSNTPEVAMAAENEEMGPIDVVVIGYPVGAPLTGEAVPLLMSLVERGIVRVLDAMFVQKDEDGRVSGFEATDLEGRSVGDFTVFEGASSGLLGEDDVATAAQALDPGTAAAMIVYENRWAAPFVAAVRRNGGQLIANQRIPVQDVVNALDAVEATA